MPAQAGFELRDHCHGVGALAGDVLLATELGGQGPRVASVKQEQGQRVRRIPWRDPSELRVGRIFQPVHCGQIAWPRSTLLFLVDALRCGAEPRWPHKSLGSWMTQQPAPGAMLRAGCPFPQGPLPTATARTPVSALESRRRGGGGLLRVAGLKRAPATAWWLTLLWCEVPERDCASAVR